MGLAGVKNKKKWAKDPNNTAWSRNADTFGQKILRSQGWAPGEYLGAKDASHSEYYSAANASHIRAVMKDDNMGLGARRNQGDECTGLDALQDLLSRLNGKSDEAMGEEKKKREDTKINRYLNRKVGTMRFVFGGLLVGDKVQELADSLKEKDQGAAKVPGQQAGDAASSSSHEESAASVKKEKKSKKRKSDDGESGEKKDKKSKKRKTDDADEDSKSKRKEKKDKKRRKERDEDDESSPGDADEAAAARKKSKKEKKEKRRKSKDDGDEDSADVSDARSKKKDKKNKRKADKNDDGETTNSSTPTVSGISTPISSAVPVPHRHLARSRFIAQKRAAVMDQAALNQIFMIKA